MPKPPFSPGQTLLTLAALIFPLACSPLGIAAEPAKEIHLADLHVFKVKPMPNAPSVGPADARVTVIAFTDYTCGFCKMEEPAFRKVLADHKGDVHFIVAHHSIAAHKNAHLAARVATAAALQGKFWEVHNLMFDKHFAARPECATIDGFIPFLQTVPGLDLEKLKRDLDSPEVAAEIATEKNAIREDSTPVFLINGHLHTGQLTEPQFNQLIQEAQQ